MAFSFLEKRAIEGTPAQKVQLRHLLGLMAGGVGLGMIGRGMVHALSPRPELSVPFISPGPSVLPIPVEEEEPPRPPRPMGLSRRGSITKLAAAVNQHLKAANKGLVDKAIDTASAFVPQSLYFGSALADSVGNPVNAPLMYPMSVGAAAAGVGGGWKLTDWLMDQRRSAQTEEELAKAKHDFHAALIAQAQAARTKRASDGESVGEKLDRLCDALEKRAANENIMDSAAWPVGLYQLAAGTLAAGAGYGTYQWTKNRSQSKLLNKALQERARRMWQQQLQPVSVVPVRVPRKDHPDEMQTV